MTEGNSLTEEWFVNIFFHSVSCLPSTDCTLMFLQIVSVSIITSSLSFALIFIFGELWGSGLFLLYTDVQFSCRHWLKRLSFLQHIHLLPLLRSTQVSLQGSVSEPALCCGVVTAW